MKKRGVILLEAVFALILLGMISYGFASTQAMAFSQQSALKDGDKARQYADLEADVIKAIGYEDFNTAGVHERRSMKSITGQDDGYESVVSLGSTVTVSEDNIIKMGKVDVYKTGEKTPRYTLQIPLSSSGGGGGGGDIIVFIASNITQVNVGGGWWDKRIAVTINGTCKNPKAKFEVGDLVVVAGWPSLPVTDSRINYFDGNAYAVERVRLNLNGKEIPIGGYTSGCFESVYSGDAETGNWGVTSYSELRNQIFVYDGSSLVPVGRQFSRIK